MDPMDQDDFLNEQLVADWEIREDELIVDREIARGSYGVVLKGQFRGTDVAVKRLLHNPHRMNDQERADFRNEIMLLQRLRHPVRLFLFQLKPALLAHPTRSFN
jgi:predicted Ser/Thr protein kinase